MQAFCQAILRISVRVHWRESSKQGNAEVGRLQVAKGWEGPTLAKKAATQMGASGKPDFAMTALLRIPKPRPLEFSDSRPLLPAAPSRAGRFLANRCQAGWTQPLSNVLAKTLGFGAYTFTTPWDVPVGPAGMVPVAYSFT